MSQAGSFFEGSGPTDVESLTGNIGGPVGPDGANNINVIGDEDSGIFVDGTPFNNTLTISNTNLTRVQVQTTDDTPTTLYSLTLTPGSVITLDAIVSGLRDDNDSGVGGRVTGVARRSAGSAILVGLPNISFAAEDAGGFQVIVSGNDILLQVIGEAAQTYNWTGLVQFISYPL